MANGSYGASKVARPAWRKALYGVVGAALAILTAFGVVSAVDAAALQNAIGDVVVSVVTAIGAVSSFLAMVKTHFGSDDPTTAADVAKAREEGRELGRREVDVEGGTNLRPPRPGSNLPVYERPDGV